MLIIFIHELGHITMAYYYKWDIDKIYLYPFGGYCKFNSFLNKPIKEEMNILMMGFIFQVILYSVILFSYHLNMINYSTVMIFKNYHYAVFYFNLLPIYPLDGSKLMNLCFSIKLPFKLSHKLMLYLSYFSLSILVYIIIHYYFNLNSWLIFFLLLTKMIEEASQHELIFNKFLMERYLYDFNFKKIKIITYVNKMYKNKRHLFKINRQLLTEKEMLKRIFKANNN